MTAKVLKLFSGDFVSFRKQNKYRCKRELSVVKLLVIVLKNHFFLSGSLRLTYIIAASGGGAFLLIIVAVVCFACVVRGRRWVGTI